MVAAVTAAGVDLIRRTATLPAIVPKSPDLHEFLDKSINVRCNA